MARAIEKDNAERMDESTRVLMRGQRGMKRRVAW
jgi:hypothetical protein